MATGSYHASARIMRPSLFQDHKFNQYKNDELSDITRPTDYLSSTRWWLLYPGAYRGRGLTPKPPFQPTLIFTMVFLPFYYFLFH